MKKKVLIGAAAGCAAVAAVAATKKDSATPKPTIWDKMSEGMEEMPEDFPPRVMFDNVEATRVNTEEILKQLEQRESSKDGIELIDATS